VPELPIQLFRCIQGRASGYGRGSRT